MGEPFSTTAMIGMAVAAAGAAANTAATVKRNREIENIRNKTRAQVEARRKEALGAWEQGLAKLTPEQQRAAIDEETKKRMAAYEAAAGDKPPGLDIVKTTDRSPTIVKTEAAKQLGSKLDTARAQMAGQAKMAGWDYNAWLQNLALGRTGEKVGQQANFMAGLVNAASSDIANYKSPTIPLGDMLQGVGSGMMQIPSGGAAPLPAMRPEDVRWANWYNQIG